MTRLFLWFFLTSIGINLMADTTEINTKRHHFQIGFNRFMHFDKDVNTLLAYNRFPPFHGKKLVAPVSISYAYHFKNDIFLKLRYSYNRQGYTYKKMYTGDEQYLFIPYNRATDVFNFELGKNILIHHYGKNNILVNPSIFASYRKQLFDYFVKHKEHFFFNNYVHDYDAFGLGSGLELMLETKSRITFSTQIQYYYFFENDFIKHYLIPDQLPKKSMAAFQTSIGYRF